MASLFQPHNRNIDAAPGRYRVHAGPVNYAVDANNKKFAAMDPTASRGGVLGESQIQAREKLVARSYHFSGGVMLCPDCADNEALFIALESFKTGGVAQTISKLAAPTVDGVQTNGGALKAIASKSGHKLFVAGSGNTAFEVSFKITPVNMTIDAQGRCYSMDGEFRFRISDPCLLGPDMTPIMGGIESEPYVTGALTDNQDGTFTYTKTPGPGFADAALPETYWIDANIVYAETSDGFLATRSSSSWTAACAGGVYTWASGSTIDYAFGGEGSGSPYWYCRRGFFIFDTSGTGISSTGAVASATLNFKVKRWYSPCGNAHLYQGTFTAFNSTNWTKFSDYLDSSAPTTRDVDDPGWMSFDLGSTGINNINLSGVTSYVLRHSGDYDATGPESYVRLYMADSSGTTDDPYLEIELAPVVLQLPESQFSSMRFSENRFSEIHEDVDLAESQAAYKLRVSVYEPFTGVLKAVYGDDIQNSPVAGAAFEFVESGCGPFSVSFNVPAHELSINRGDRIDIHLMGSSQPWFSGQIITLPAISTSTQTCTFKGHGFFSALDQIIVTETYTDMALEDIVADLADNYLTGADILFFTDRLPKVGYRVQSVEFDREPLKDALATLAGLANGYVFGVNENREFFFTAREGRPSLQFSNKTSQWVGHHLGAFELSEKADKIKNKMHVKMGSVSTTEGNFADFTTSDLDSIAFFGLRSSVESAPDIKHLSDAQQWAAHQLEQKAWPMITGKAKDLQIAPWVTSKDDLIRTEGAMRVSMPRTGLVGPFYEPLAGYYRHQDLSTVQVYGVNRVKRTFAPRMGGFLGRVSALAKSTGAPGPLTLAVKKGSITVATATVTAPNWFTWIDFDLSDCLISAAIDYTLEFYETTGDASNYHELNYCTTDGPFSGAYYASTNGGASWAENTANGLVFRAYLVHENEYILSIKKASYSVKPTGISASLELGAIDTPLEDHILELVRRLRAAELMTQNNSKEIV